MSENTRIEWADHTFNPWTGCQAISLGCKHCYAEAWAKRSGRNFATRQRTKTWRDPVKWNAKHAEFFAEHGRRQRVFCASLADVFDNEVPEHWRWDLFRLIAATPSLDWLLLTKRIGNARAMLNSAAAAVAGEFVGATEWDRQPWPNVWLGATVVNQEEADRDIPKLLATPARVRFLSIEPMLSDIRLGSFLQLSPSAAFAAGRVTPDMPAWTRLGSTRIDWVIAGGESGHHARPMHSDWARSLRDECTAGGVPFLFKQWGEWRPICQGGADWYQPLYRSNRIARVDEDQRALDDVWGRRCTVPELCLRDDGQHAAITEPNAWQAGARPVHAFKIGKKTAGRLLDGVEHNGFPEVA